MIKFKNKKAFTLAEVLITLGIIGVVAAMTIPTLINNYQKKQNVAKLQKAISVLSNGFRLLMAQEGVNVVTHLSLYNCDPEIGTVGLTNTECVTAELGKVFKIAKAQNGIKDKTEYPYSDIKMLSGSSGAAIGAFGVFSMYSFYTQDGMLILPSFTPDNIPPLSGLVDVNGAVGPNQVGKDIFFLTMNEQGVYTPYGVGGEWNKPSNKNNYCGDDVSAKGNGYACAARIFDEGWKMNY